MSDNTDKIANHPKHMKRAAEEALKAAKLLEAQRVAAGAKWIQYSDRSWRLKR